MPPSARKELGLHVVVCDMDPNAPGFAFADDHLIADSMTPEQTAEPPSAITASVRPIDGVICVAPTCR